jgi:alkanesulfonate monooxygenase SsuD/methylene tetrahydromethanopterin reductase-like flavin-dependent oxidoreductase (luciferase family)
VPKVRPPTSAGSVGFILPTFPQEPSSPADDSGDPTASPVALREVCRGAEAIGADALWACDHLFWHGPSLECMTALSIAATATERAFVGSCVLQLPLRDPASVAKQTSTLQHLTAGRMVLGVGVGSHPGEYDRAGVDYHRRGRRLDEGVRELRRAWATADAPVARRGDSEGRDTYSMLPHAAAVPVWIGGSSEAALRRAARLGDGWMPLFLSPTEYAGALERLAKEVDRVGREPGAVTPSMVLFVSVDDDEAWSARRGAAWMSSMYRLPAKAFERHLVAGTARQVAAAIGTYRDAGAAHVVVYVTADRPLGQFEQLADALRAAGAAAPA